MSETLRTRCVCGWESTGTEDEVVEATLDHGLRIHNMPGTREQVLERAERVAADESVDELVVVDMPERRRFEAQLGSKVVGFSQYRLNDAAIELLHTEIDPDVEGKGFGSRLAADVLASVTARGLAVTVRCPFISAYVRRHRADYPDIVLEGDRAAAT